MMTFNILAENVLIPKGNPTSFKTINSLGYIPKYPGRSLLTTLGSAGAGGYLGYKALEQINPYLGISMGVLGGAYGGDLAAEYIDRKIREKEGTPYRGARSFADTAQEHAGSAALGSLVSAGMASNPATAPYSILVAGPLSGLGGRIVNRLNHPENYVEIKKEKK